MVVNSGLVAFTGDNTINYPWYSRVWIFFGMSAGIQGMKYLIAMAVPDVPLEVEIQLKRNEYYLDKIVHNVPDDDNDEILANIRRADNRYVIRVNDDDPL